MTPTTPDATAWWRHAVIYEVYPWSFVDGDGDGVGDLAGAITRLDDLAGLGADAVWFTPWFPSPWVDGGYDVSDYENVDPRLGTLDDLDRLVREAHQRGLRVVMDMVANHTSDQHPWFQAALSAPPGSPERSRYFFRDGRGPDGSEPPNNWICGFGGSAWRRTTDPDGSPGQWYLHTFSPEQPDLNWGEPSVAEGVLGAVDFWFRRGIDGVRVDAAPAMWKVDGLPDATYDPEEGFNSRSWVDSPHWDADGIHGILRAWRHLADSFTPPRMIVVESVVSSPDRLAAYLRPDEAHTAFNFDFLYAGWDADRLRSAIAEAIPAHASVGATPTWALGSHDETRVVTRLGRGDTQAGNLAFDHVEPGSLDRERGSRRARAAALIQLGLPGMACIYQGDELGLPEVMDLPPEALATDPVYTRTGGAARGRAGCRVPLPWAGQQPPYGFSPNDAQPWLPQPADWGGYAVAAQRGDDGSFLEFYRRALALRRRLGTGDLADFGWVTTDGPVLAFDSGRLRVVANLGIGIELLDPDATVLIASGELPGGGLPPDTTVWLSR